MTEQVVWSVHGGGQASERVRGDTVGRAGGKADCEGRGAGRARKDCTL